MNNLRHFESWERQRLRVFVKNGHPPVYLLTEYNPHYGDLITCFQIGNRAYTTKVKSRYTNNYLWLSEQNNRIGMRKFLRNSITYEFLWIKLRLRHQGKPIRNGGKILYTHFYSVQRALKAQGYEPKD